MRKIQSNPHISRIRRSWGSNEGVGRRFKSGHRLIVDKSAGRVWYDEVPMDRKNWFKFIIGWALVFAYRLMPFRVPNVEPVLAVAMPFSKKYGAWAGFLFGLLSIALFDVAMGSAGWWTVITALAYGLVGAGAAWFFRKREAKTLNFLAYGIMGTIAYDALTGLTVGPLLFGQPLAAAFFGQVPFTLMHLAGTAVFSLVVSPLVYRWIVRNPSLDTGALFGRIAGAGAAS